MGSSHKEFHEDLRNKINNWLESPEGKNSKWSKYIKHTPDIFKLVCELSMEKKVDDEIKAKLAPVVAYFVSPYDYIPEEFYGALGFTDDIILSSFVLNDIIDDLDDDVLNKHWDGKKDIRSLIEDINENAKDMVGEKYYNKLKDRMD